MEKVLLISLLLIGVISSCSNNEDNIPVDDYSKSTVHESIYIISHEESVVSQQILYIIPIYSHHFFTF